MDKVENKKDQELPGQELSGQEQKKPEAKKTTPDEGKTFEKDTVFVCVQDCYQSQRRFRKGDELAGKKCPPFFVVKPEVEKEKK